MATTTRGPASSAGWRRRSAAARGGVPPQPKPPDPPDRSRHWQPEWPTGHRQRPPQRLSPRRRPGGLVGPVPATASRAPRRGSRRAPPAWAGCRLSSAGATKANATRTRLSRVAGNRLPTVRDALPSKFGDAGHAHIDALSEAVGCALDGRVLTREELGLRCRAADGFTGVRRVAAIGLGLGVEGGLVPRARRARPGGAGAVHVAGELGPWPARPAPAGGRAARGRPPVPARLRAGHDRGPVARCWAGPLAARRVAPMLAAVSEEAVQVDVEGRPPGRWSRTCPNWPPRRRATRRGCFRRSIPGSSARPATHRRSTPGTSRASSASRGRISPVISHVSTRLQWFASARLPVPHLTRSSPGLPVTLTAPGIDPTRLTAVCRLPCRATAEDLPPSPVQHRSRSSPSTSTSPVTLVAHAVPWHFGSAHDAQAPTGYVVVVAVIASGIAGSSCALPDRRLDRRVHPPRSTGQILEPASATKAASQLRPGGPGCEQLCSRGRAGTPSPTYRILCRPGDRCGCARC